ncbi:MAG: hypothetical protein R3C68_12015 [Myxococcota bacterium]
MTLRVHIEPQMLRWALDRAGLSIEAVLPKFPKAQAWLEGRLDPTLKQVEKFAKTTYTPVGFLMLDKPPVETVPIPDLRTVGNAGIGHPSPDLLDTIYICQQRQQWYAEFARAHGLEPAGFVGSVPLGADVVETAAQMREALGFKIEERTALGTWTEALQRFIEMADALGVLIMMSGARQQQTVASSIPMSFVASPWQTTGSAGVHQRQRQQVRADVHTRP